MINCTLLKRAPKPMSPKKLYFRNGNTLANISAADSQTRLLRAMGVPLGQLSSAPERARLLATDEAHSILSAQHTQGIQASQYSPYGHRAVENQATALGYNGELLEPFDYYLLGHGNRAYSTRLRRFLSPDRAGIFLKNNFNCYAYAAGDPVNYTDPSGNSPVSIKGALRQLGLMKASSPQKTTTSTGFTITFSDTFAESARQFYGLLGHFDELPNNRTRTLAHRVKQREALPPLENQKKNLLRSSKELPAAHVGTSRSSQDLSAAHVGTSRSSQDLSAAHVGTPPSVEPTEKFASERVLTSFDVVQIRTYDSVTSYVTKL